MLKLKKSVLYLLIVSWMIFIFVMSSQQASKSSQVSGGIVYKLITVLFGEFDSMTLENQTEIINAVTFIVRKAAHFFEYFILGILSALIVLTYDLKFKLKLSLAFGFCLLYAISDEIHQFFVPGRACRFADICIDSIGSLMAISFVIFMAYIYKKHKFGELNEKE